MAERHPGTDGSHNTRPDRGVWIRGIVFVVLLAGLTVTGYLLPLHRVASDAARLGPVVAIATATALLLALVPRTAVSLACGALFGAVAGTVYAYLAAFAGATIAFGIGRLLGRGFVARYARGRLSTVDFWLRRRGTLAVLVVRLLPVAPYGLVSYAYGSSATRTHHYLAGSALGAVPASITYAILGAAASSPRAFNPLTLIPAVLGFGVTLSVLLYWRRRNRREAGVEAAGTPTPTDPSLK